MAPLSNNQTNNAPAKPFVPQVSPAFRAKKSPLTPKLAGYNNTPPLPRKLAQSPLPNVAKTPDSSSTPTSSTLSANVTPRSVSRKLRRDGVPTSSAPPHSLQHNSRTGRSTAGIGGVTESGPNHQENGVSHFKVSNTKNFTFEAPGSKTNSRPGSSCGSSVGSPMFFHADDARSSTSSYDLEPRPHSTAPSHSTPKSYFYADRSLERPQSHVDSSRKSILPSKRPGGGQGPVLAKSPEIASPRLQESHLPISQRRNSATSDTESRKLVASPVQPEGRRSSHIPRLSSSGDLTPLSPETPRRIVHMKSPSLDTSQLFARKQSFLTSPPLSHSTLAHDNAPQSNASPDASPLVANHRSSASADIQHPFPRAASPTKDNPLQGNNFQKMNEMATNARRERKVLDLEISNSSLLAINRALEREMRKQTAELRRFRRLSRSGRLSMTPSRRSVSGGGLSMVSETDGYNNDGMPMSGRSSIMSNDDTSDLSDDVASSASEGESMTSSAVADHDERHLPRDEKRFLLDLSNHQQLLIDSQKMNQSIKRCLGWTDNLISEGRKALEYNVRVSDIDIGGRVLDPDEMSEGYAEHARGLLSPTTEVPEPADASSPSDDDGNLLPAAIVSPGPLPFRIR